MALARDPARRRLQALPALRRALPLRRHLPGPPGPLPLRALRRRGAPSPRSRRTDVALDGVRSAAFELHIGGRALAVALPLPGLYNVYNALGAAALAGALGIPLPTSWPGCEATRGRVRARGDASASAGRELSILLVKNPAGANEVLRTLALEGGEHDVLAVLNDRIADGRDVSWVWDADFELLAGRVRRVTCSGTRAAELALRLKYAGVAPERLVVEPDLARALDAALAAASGPLFALPTYTAMLALRELLVATRRAGERGRSREQRRGHLARRGVRLLRRSTCRCGASWPTAPAGRFSTSAPAPAG